MSSIIPKNERKQVNLRYHSSRVDFFCSFFGRIEDTKKDISKLTDLYESIYYIALLCSNLETQKDCRIGTEVQKTIENFHMVLTLCYTKLLCSSLRNGKIYEKKV